MEELGRLSPSAFEGQEKIPLVLVLDNVRSALNVGSAFRTADAFALEKIYLCGITATPPHREILKTALGATETVAWEYHEKTAPVLETLKSDGYLLLAVEQVEGSTYLQEYKSNHGQKVALVFGNEVDGVEDHLLSQVDGALEIPQFGTKHSINVAVAIGIVVWELVKQLKYEHR